MPNNILDNNSKYTLYHWQKQQGLAAISIDRGEGIYFWDTSGKRYIDFSSQLMNVNIGHGNQQVTAAVVAQMQQISHVNPGIMATQARGLLGKKLSQFAPSGLNKTFFTLCGSSANETALMMARQYTGKHKIISRYRSYHGTSAGAISVSGDPRRLGFDKNLLSGIVRVEDPYTYRCPWGQTTAAATCTKALEHLERVIQFEGAANIAAIFMEGESGTSGCIKYPAGYLAGVKALCVKYVLLLIADEVMSGFGRCGSWFAVDNAGVVPDMITMAKGLTSGYLPLGGVMVNDDLAAYFDDNVFAYGMTYGAHPVACAAALANIAVIEEENLIANTRNMGAYLSRALAKLQNKHVSIGDVRLTGLLGVIELVKNRDSKQPLVPWNSSGTDMLVMQQITNKLTELGLHTFCRWNYIFLAPPLIINQAQIDASLELISQALTIADDVCV